MKKIAFIVAIALAAVGCCDCRKSESGNHKPLNVTEWRLQQVEGRNVASLLTEESVPTLVLSADGSYGGNGGCNNYGGQYTIVPSELSYQKDSVGKIDFGAMYSTKRYCPNDKFEYEFFGLLDKVDSFTIEGDRLYLFTDGELKLVFVAGSK